MAITTYESIVYAFQVIHEVKLGERPQKGVYRLMCQAMSYVGKDEDLVKFYKNTAELLSNERINTAELYINKVRDEVTGNQDH